MESRAGRASPAGPRRFLRSNCSRSTRRRSSNGVVLKSRPARLTSCGPGCRLAKRGGGNREEHDYHRECRPGPPGARHQHQVDVHFADPPQMNAAPELALSIASGGATLARELVRLPFRVVAWPRLTPGAKPHSHPPKSPPSKKIGVQEY